MAMLRLEFGIARLLFKEILKCPVQISQGFLQSHTVNRFQPHEIWMAFQFCQHMTGLYIGYRLTLLLPAIPSDSKKMIIHKACTSQCLIYDFLLLSIWIDSKLEPLCVLHFLTSFRNYVCKYILSYLQKTYNRTARKIVSVFILSTVNCLRKLGGHALYPHV